MREITAIILILGLIGMSIACSSSRQPDRNLVEKGEPEDLESIYFKVRNDPRSVSDEEWRLILDQPTFYVTRQKGTERPWTSPHNHEKRSGVFKCSLCHQPLFSSNTVKLDIRHKKALIQ